jgi:hypothetical protein
MRRFSKPYSTDIIEDVFLAIEGDQSLLQRYKLLADELRGWVVNRWIGRYTKRESGMKSIRQVEARRSNLITSYTKLGR